MKKKKEVRNSQDHQQNAEKGKGLDIQDFTGVTVTGCNTA